MAGSISPEWQEFILQTVFPSVGVLTGTFMSFAPFRAVLKASRDGNLGDINPTPWVFMLGNCVGWLAYSFLLKNVYVFLPNASGVILAIWLNIQAIKLQYENHRSVEMQNAIIDALEELESSRKSGQSSPPQLTKARVEAIVEQVIIEDAPPIEMINPITTAPVLEEGAQEAQMQNGTPGEDEYSTQSTISTVKENGYGALGGKGPSDVENLKNKSDSDTERFEDEDDDGFTPIGDRRPSFLQDGVQSAADAFVDYANFVWDVTAQKTPAPASHELMVIGISSFWLVVFTVVVFTEGILDFEQRCLIVGILVNLNLIFFYGAPLSKIAIVLETRCSKLIHIPTMIFSLANGALWFIYGIAVGDLFIAVPNGLGAFLGLVQVAMVIIFPRHLPRESGDGLISVASSTSLSLPIESTPLI